MRLNEATILVGDDVFLVPYRALARKEHVPRYHEWMADPAIQEATASEPLTLEEEHDMQRTWHVDEDKLTFIILSRKEKAHRPNSLTAEMVGDVNLFLSAKEDDSCPTDLPDNAQSSKEGELEIMIAEPTARRKGAATQALNLMMPYALQNGLVQSPADFLVKIGMQNERSIQMFSKLGFEIVKEVAVFQEVEMRIREQDEVTRWHKLAETPVQMLQC